MLKYLKKNNLKVGFLGGSFDPPHKGHVKISEVALKKLKLDYVVWIVTKRNPFKKKPDLDILTRVKLSKKILKNLKKKIKVEYLDHVVKSSLAYDTLNYLKKFKKKNKFFFLIGADNLIHLHKWHKWKKMPKIAKIIVFDRPYYSRKALNSLAFRKMKNEDRSFINFDKINISSTKLKKI